MTKVTLVVPATQTAEKYAQMEDRLLRAAGGYTRYACTGGWVPSGKGVGSAVVEDNLAYVMMVRSKDVKKLKAVGEWAREAFGQEAVYFEVQDSAVTLIVRGKKGGRT